MKKLKKIEGFTLIELLAVIVILSIILVIVVPKIMKLITESKINSMESTVKLAAKAVESTYEVSLTNGETEVLSKSGSCIGIANLDIDEYDTCLYTIDDNGKAKVSLKGTSNGKFANMVCVDGTKVEAKCALNISSIITFDGNGFSDEIPSKVVILGETYGTLPTPVRKVYTFLGWYTEKEGGTKIESTTNVSLNTNQTLYAHWTYDAKVVNIDATLTQGYEYDDGTYLYRYKQEYKGSGWDNISIDGWGITLKNKSQTEVNVDACSIINGKPVVSVKGMFAGATSLTKVNLDNFDTSNVVNMYGMFYYATSLKTVDLSNLDTSKVVNMQGLFSDCYSITSLDLSNLDTSNTKNMSYMFYNLRSLTNINLSNLDTSSATTMEGMFEECRKIETLDLSNFNTSNVTNMYAMFYCTSSLKNVNLSSFDTRKVKTMEGMFNGASSLSSLDLSSFNMSNVSSVQAMLSNTSIKSIKVKTDADKNKLNSAGLSSSAVITVLNK